MKARTPFEVRDVARGRGLLALGVRGRGVDGPDVVVLVAVVVLDVEDQPAVARPEERGDRPLGLGREQPCLLEGLARLLHVDVARVVPGLQERDVLPVGRELRRGDLGVAEEQLAVEQRRQRRARAGRGLGGDGGRADRSAGRPRGIPPAGRRRRLPRAGRTPGSERHGGHRESWVQGLLRGCRRRRSTCGARAPEADRLLWMDTTLQRRDTAAGRARFRVGLN